MRPTRAHEHRSSVTCSQPFEMDAYNNANLNTKSVRSLLEYNHITSSSVVIDIQCFKDNDNEFIIKEATVMDLMTGSLLLHNIALPPYDRSVLSDDRLRESYWASKHCHGLEWEQGDIPYHVLMDRLRACLSQRKVIYVKGLEKKRFIKNHLLSNLLLPRPSVIDIAVYGCQSLTTIGTLLSADTIRCGQHKNSHKDRCSLAHTGVMRSWLLLTGSHLVKGSPCYCSSSPSSHNTSSGVDELDIQ